MFGFGKKDKKATESKPTLPQLYAICNGTVANVESIPDEVFAQKMLGDGFCVIPSSNDIASPCDGTIIDVQDSLHAYGIETSDGLEILVHIGVNTVEMNGKGFKAKVKVGDKVSAGQTICTADFDLIRANNYPDNVVVLITSMDKISSMNVHTGDCVKGETIALDYTLA